MAGLAMSWSEWAKHDATALAGLVRRGDVSPRELAAQVSAGVDKLDSRLNAVLERFADVLANPDTDGPNRQGLLYGVPMFLKDLGAALKGRTQECGSLMYKGAVAKATDPTVENFLNAGLVPIGRSTTPEHGMSFDTTTNYTGTVKVTRNPYNLERTSGGSSGGSAAVVAAGITPISMSGDGGGSTRIPASFCGLVGLKTTRGRVPRLLAQNEYGNRFSADGVVTRSVRDTAAAMEYMTRVPNGGSFMHLGPPRESYLGALAKPPGRLRVGLSTGAWGRSGSVDGQVATHVREAAKLLESLGHHVEEIDDASICDWNAMWQGYIMQWISRGALFEFEMQALGIKPDDLHKYLNPITYLHYEASKRYDKFDVYRAMSFNNATTRAFGRLMERHDILLTPTLAIRAPQANGPYSLLSDSNDLDGWVNMLADACRFTMPGNETGLPAISVPAGLDADGLPIGVQVHGNFCAETTLLQVAAQIEAARPDWFNRVPANHVTKD